MSAEDAVQALRNDFNDLREEVRGWGGKIDAIHTAVSNLRSATYVPGPPKARRSLWARIGSLLGMFL